MKSESIKELERMADEAAKLAHPGMPHLAPRKFDDKTANSLTRAIITYLQLKNHQAERISVTGRPQDNTRIVTDVLGSQRRIGSVTWIPGTMTRGSADISSTIRGRSVKWEVKVKKDKQSEFQKKYQESIERAGGYYFIVHNFMEFIERYNSIE
jgi:hypothetical protein